MTPPPYTCWFRVRTYKTTDRKVRVSIVAAIKPTATAPKTTPRDARHGWKPEVYVFPAGWLDRVRADAQRTIEAGRRVAKAAGLDLHEESIEDEMERFALRPVAAIDYVNFFWLSVEIPFKAGQKKLAASLADEFAKLGVEFAGEMDVDLVREG